MKPCLAALLCLAPLAAANPEAKPWTRWWWLGSGVDEKNLTRQLEEFAAAGIGGVEICPIYGAKGYEDRNLRYLSPAWVVAYTHAAEEAARLGMKLDLTTGTGWPFGGPRVEEAAASASLQNVKASAEGGRSFSLELPQGTVRVLSAWPENGPPLDLRGRVKEGRLQWTPPEGNWRIHGLVSKHGIQKVKRAAPGGAGWVLDPFSTASMKAYLEPFSAALDPSHVPQPRAHFHDSFEYYGATWTDRLLPRFRELRGYDLAEQLPAFHGEGDPDTIARVRADYRETMGELHREYLAAWHDWAQARGSLTRNQAHGSPGNLLDHYAVADIPETEIFRHVEDKQIPMLRFAASAARLRGGKLVSAEAFTWLDEHFRVTPAQLKEAADFLWLGGVNHIVYHGIPYTPEDAGWPGWLFYASTHMGPQGGLWRDLPAFNAYVERVQTALQAGLPDTDCLLYFPMHDLWQDGSEGLPLFTIHNQDKWLHGSPAWNLARDLEKAGLSYDFISDRGLGALSTQGLSTPDGRKHRAIVVPRARFMPVETLRRLLDLAAAGNMVIFAGGMPQDVPGLGALEKRRAELAELKAGISARGVPGAVIAKEGQKDWLAGLGGEDLAAKGLSFVRRKTDGGWNYFIVNRTGKDIDAEIRLREPGKHAVLRDPWSDREGRAEVKEGKVRLVLHAGESRILNLSRKTSPGGPIWKDLLPSGEPQPLAGNWQVEFIAGGPELPPSYETSHLASWTLREGESYRDFSGTARYRLRFRTADAAPALLDLGGIAHTARVRLNGKDLGTCWAPPHRLPTGDALKAGENLLEIEVTNLAANRIADLDRRKVPWKAFHEINFVNIDYKPFDASAWEPLPSGLLGPVALLPLK